MSDQINELAKALSIAQGTFENPAKDRENPYFKSRYATLDALQNATRKALAENGLAVTQLPQPGPDGWELHTMLIHQSGQSITSRLPLLTFAKGAQAAGSEITYMRRYAYASILSITAEEDDDGNTAQNSGAAPERKSGPYPGVFTGQNAPAPGWVPPEQSGDMHQVGMLGKVDTSNDGKCWFIELGAFSAKGSGNSVWTRDQTLAMSLVKEQGQVINVHLRSKKPGSYQIISYIPAEEQT